MGGTGRGSISGERGKAGQGGARRGKAGQGGARDVTRYDRTGKQWAPAPTFSMVPPFELNKKLIQKI